MVKKYSDLYLQARRALLPSEGENASMAARELLAFASGKSVTAVLADSNLYASEQIEEKLSSYVNRMLAHEPLPYILGQWDFYGISLEVTPDVLIPRDDTMAVTDLALDVLRGREAPRVLDLCCGTGCIGISLAALSGAAVTLADISVDALALARENAEKNGVCARVMETDLFSNITGSFDLIACNPPYLSDADMAALQREVRFEPALALYGGEDGLDFYRRIRTEYAAHLNQRGALLLEVGFGQAAAVCALFGENAYVLRDLCGVERVVAVC